MTSPRVAQHSRQRERTNALAQKAASSIQPQKLNAAKISFSRFPRSTLFGPAAQQTPDYDQLPEVIGVVIGD